MIDIASPRRRRSSGARHASLDAPGRSPRCSRRCRCWLRSRSTRTCLRSPRSRREFDVAPIAVQQTLSVYLFAYAFMMLWHGALSDALGRRPVVLGGARRLRASPRSAARSPGTSSRCGSSGCCRDCPPGTGLVVGRAIIRDRFHGAEAQRLMSQMTLVFGIAPAIAPVMGGAVLDSARLALDLLGAAGVDPAACSSGPREACPRRCRASHVSRCTRARCGATTAPSCSRPEFALLASIPALNFAGFFIYIAGAPAFLIDLLGVSTLGFAWLFVPMISGIMIGAVLSGRLAGRRSPHHTVRLSYELMAAASCSTSPSAGCSRRASPGTCCRSSSITIGSSLMMPSRHAPAARSLPVDARDGVVAAGIRCTSRCRPSSPARSLRFSHFR